MSSSRREVLAVAAATVSLPMLDAALRTMRFASASASAAPATAPATAPAATAPAAAPARGGRGGAPAEKPGWFTTTLKPADLKNNEFTAVEGHQIVVTRTDKTVLAITNKCTHQGCTINPKAGSKTLVCPCHHAEFNLDGTVAKSPARNPLSHYAIRVNDNGLIEIDPGQKPAKPDDKDGSITIAPATAPATSPAA